MPQGNSMPEIHILMVEDNPGDVLLTVRALKKMSLPHRVHIVENGGDALAFLKRDGDYTDAPVPDMILMDINLPDMEGYDVIRTLKDDWKFSGIPMVVLSGSKNDADVKKSFEGHADRYWLKPANPEEYKRLARKVEELLLDQIIPD